MRSTEPSPIPFVAMAVVLMAILLTLDWWLNPNLGALALFGGVLGIAMGRGYNDIQGWILRRREAKTRKVEP